MTACLPFCAARRCARPFVDLGLSPLANAYLPPEQLRRDGAVLSAACSASAASCLLVQLEEFETPGADLLRLRLLLVYSDSWLEHCRAPTPRHGATRFGLGAESHGRRGREQRRLPAAVLRGARRPGARRRAGRQRRRGGRSRRASRPRSAFFGTATAQRLARRGRRADLMVGNNVLAHVPDLNDFVGGLQDPAEARGGGHGRVPAPAAADRGEPVRHDLPRALLVLLAARGRRASSPAHGLRVVRRRGAADPRRLAARLRAPRRRGAGRAADAVATVLDARARGRARPARRPIDGFARRSCATKCDAARIPDREAHGAARRVAGYGAPAKGNTLLNYCGIGPDCIDYTVDRSPHKQGRFLPGTHIPIHAPDASARDAARLRADPAVEPEGRDHEQMAAIRDWGGRFVVPIPELTVF